MRSLQRTMRLTGPALLATWALSGCAGGPSIEMMPIALDCAARVPPQLRAGTPGAAPPAANTVGEWVAFGDAQTGRLEAANDSKATALWIIDQCEAEARNAAGALRPRPWWRWW